MYFPLCCPTASLTELAEVVSSVGLDRLRTLALGDFTTQFDNASEPAQDFMGLPQMVFGPNP